MFLAALRIRTSDGQIGTNVLMYEHGPAELVGMSWESPDIQRVAESEPGTLVASHIEVAPGGNTVMSYLEVAAHDRIAADVLDRALAAAAPSPGQPLPMVTGSAGVAIRFGAVFGLRGAERAEYEDLAVAAIELYCNPTPVTAARPEPLRIVVAATQDGTRFALEEASAERLRRVHGPNWRPAPLSIQRDVQSDFEMQVGQLGREVAAIVTGLPMEQIRLLGGVVFVEQAAPNRAMQYPFAPRVGEGSMYAVRSGRFLGWRSGGQFFNRTGQHIGYFVGNVLYSLEGDCIAQGYPTHPSFLGMPRNQVLPRSTVHSQFGSRLLPARPDKEGINDANWEDPAI